MKVIQTQSTEAKRGRKPRAYRQTARAKAAERTGERIVEALKERLRVDWYDDITLEQVASDAGVTVQTVLRRFGSKEGLLEAAAKKLNEEISGRRKTPVGAVEAAVSAITGDYELTGDPTIRFLAQEARVPALKILTELGRKNHRSWVEESFGPYIAGFPDDMREKLVGDLMAALDVYVWQVLRRDLMRTRDEVIQHMLRNVRAILAEQPTSAGTMAE